jgi:transcriptional regulator with PAS, ATPase and Fis domain
MAGNIPAAFYEQIANSTGIGILIINTEGIVVFANDKYIQFLKKQPHEILGRHITTLLPNTRLLEVLKHQQPEFSSWVLQDNEYLCGHRIPLFYEGKLYGVMAQLIFQNLDEITKITQQLRKIKSRLEHYQEALQNAVVTKHAIVGRSQALKNALATALKAARSNSSVLITGETGVGKEVFAQTIHNASARASKPFIKINCAAIPPDLLESELFGYEGGAFTGAKRQGKPGKFELAHEGTIFLDEIGDMLLLMQVKLLRVLQERELERVGGISPTKVDVRVIAATNRDLEQLVAEKKFRSDLYYRLNVIPLNLPSLRERPEDIPELIHFYLNGHQKEHGHQPPRFSQEALAVLKQYHWPGNIRELFNLLERIANLYEGGEITPLDLPPHIYSAPLRRLPPGSNNLKKLLDSVEKKIIERALSESGGNKRQSAARLGIHRVTLYEKIKKLKVNVPSAGAISE